MLYESTVLIEYNGRSRFHRVSTGMSAKKLNQSAKEPENRPNSLVQKQDDTLLSNLTGALDRSLPVPVGTQLRGLIAFGIGLGELSPGYKLPSVRDLANRLGIAPMTVTTVYNELRDAGLIEARPGAGTYVANRVREDRGRASALRRLQRRVDQMFREAETLGLTGADVSALVSARMARGRMPGERPVHMVMLGNFMDATRHYADRIAVHLGMNDTIIPMTIGAVQTGAALPDPLDLVVTLANRRGEVETLVPTGLPVVGLSFIPSEETRTRLAAIDPDARVCIVSIFREFMALMKPGVLRFTPHVADVDVRMVDDPGLDEAMSRADVVIYASGAESVLTRLPDPVQAFEYRHVPDPQSIRTVLLPMLEQIRAGLPQPEETL